jgi:hypothetical protein
MRFATMYNRCVANIQWSGRDADKSNKRMLTSRDLNLECVEPSPERGDFGRISALSPPLVRHDEIISTFATYSIRLRDCRYQKDGVRRFLCSDGNGPDERVGRKELRERTSAMMLEVRRRVSSLMAAAGLSDLVRV